MLKATDFQSIEIVKFKLIKIEKKALKLYTTNLQSTDIKQRIEYPNSRRWNERIRKNQTQSKEKSWIQKARTIGRINNYGTAYSKFKNFKEKRSGAQKPCVCEARPGVLETWISPVSTCGTRYVFLSCGQFQSLGNKHPGVPRMSYGKYMELSLTRYWLSHKKVIRLKSVKVIAMLVHRLQNCHNLSSI